MSDIFSAEELLAIQRMLSETPPEPETKPFTLNLDGPFTIEPEKSIKDIEAIVDIEWPTYGIEDLERLMLNPLPYPVDIYVESGKKESGLIGVLTGKDFRRIFPISAPQEGRHWEDSCACFVPHIIVWNGVKTIPYTDEAGITRRGNDGSLMGDWPKNPPRKETLRDPAKARLAVFDE